MIDARTFFQASIRKAAIWLSTATFLILPAFSDPAARDPSLPAKQGGFHVAMIHSLSRGDGSSAGVAVELARENGSYFEFRHLILTTEGNRWHHSLYRDAPSGLQRSYFVDEESGWWVRQEIDDGLRSADSYELGAQRMRRSGEAQTIVVHWSFANGLSLEKTIDVPEGDPGTAVPLQAAALRELLGSCESFPPTVIKALQEVKENGEKVATSVQALIPLAEACGLQKRGRDKELLVSWTVVSPKLERVADGLEGRSREILGSFTTIDADRPDATDRLPAGLQLVLGKQIVWPAESLP